MNLLPERTRGFLYVFRLRLSIREIRIHEHSDYGGVWNQLAQQFQSLCPEITEVDVYTGGVTPWPTQAVDESNRDRVSGRSKYNRNRRGRSLGRQRRRSAGRGHHDHSTTTQIGRQHRQPVILAVCPAILDRHVLAFDVAGFVQAAMECGQKRRIGVTRPAIEVAYHWHRWLLRAPGQRPRGRRAAEQRDELAAPHSITSLAA